ncbi:holin family protein [Roseobacter sp. A03A-229]
MGLISGILNIIFGNDRNVIAQTAEVFRENTEEGAERAQNLRLGAMAQFAQEFEVARQGWFDRVMDGVNRLPRPALALGTLGLFLAAMIDPVWFAARMQGIALVPEPLWWLLGVIVSFYFGARHQVKSQQFQKSLARTMSFAPKVVDNIATLGALRATTPGLADAGHDAQLSTLSVVPDDNSALQEWKAQKAATK